MNEHELREAMRAAMSLTSPPPPMNVTTVLNAARQAHRNRIGTIAGAGTAAAVVTVVIGASVAVGHDGGALPADSPTLPPTPTCHPPVIGVPSDSETPPIGSTTMPTTISGDATVTGDPTYPVPPTDTELNEPPLPGCPTPEPGCEVYPSDFAPTTVTGSPSFSPTETCVPRIPPLDPSPTVCDVEPYQQSGAHTATEQRQRCPR